MSLGDKLIIKQLDERNVLKVVELLISTFGRWPDRDLDCSPLDHYKWKYFDNPYEKRNIVVAEIDDNIMGCDHEYFLKVKLGNEIHPVTQGTDTAVRPEYQGKGVYKRLAEKKKEYSFKNGTSFSYWITDNPIFLDYAKRKQRPSLPYPLHNLLKVQNIQLHLRMTGTKKSTLKSIGYTLKKTLSSIKYSEQETENSDFKIKTVKAFDERVDVFWDKVKDDYSFIVERKKEYLNYRYCDPRAGYYRIISADGEDDEILGYAVSMINPNNMYATSNILDILTVKNRLDVANALIKNMLVFIESKGINVVRAWALDRTELLETYRRNGFVISTTNPPGMFFGPEYRVSNEELLHKIEEGMIHLQMGDTEWM